MELKIKKDDTEVSCAISGKLTYQDHNEYRDFLRSCEDLKFSKITIELDNLTLIDSAGMGMLLLTIEKSKDFGCDLSIKNPKGQVLKMIELANISSIVTIEKIKK